MSAGSFGASRSPGSWAPHVTCWWRERGDRVPPVSVTSHAARCDGGARRPHAAVRVELPHRTLVRSDEAVLSYRSHSWRAWHSLPAGDPSAALSQQAQSAPGDLLVAQHRSAADVVLPREPPARLLLGHGV